MCFAVFGFNFLFFVLVLSSNNGWYQFRRRVSVVGLIHCPLLWAWEFLSDLRSPPEFGTLSTISVCLRMCLNLCTYMNPFDVYLGEEVERQPCLVRGHTDALQTAQSEFKGSFEFKNAENWISPTHYSTSAERYSVAD